jgi:hypothetical protein
MYIVQNIDVNAPIIPGKGIGEIVLLENAFSLRPLILSNTLSEKEIDWTFQTQKQFPDRMTFNYKNILLVDVNIYTGKIISITVKKGFTGKIYETIGIGSTVKDLLSIDSAFYYDEADEYMYHKTDSNMYFDIDVANRLSPTDEEVLNSKITAITILNSTQSSISIGATEFPKEWI